MAFTMDHAGVDGRANGVGSHGRGSCDTSGCHAPSDWMKAAQQGSCGCETATPLGIGIELNESLFGDQSRHDSTPSIPASRRFVRLVEWVVATDGLLGKLRREGVDPRAWVTPQEGQKAAHVIASYLQSDMPVPEVSSDSLIDLESLLKTGRDSFKASLSSLTARVTSASDVMPLCSTVGGDTPGCFDTGCQSLFNKPLELKFAKCENSLPTLPTFDPEEPLVFDCTCWKVDLWPLVSWVLLLAAIAAAIAGGIFGLLALLRLAVGAIRWVPVMA